MNCYPVTPSGGRALLRSLLSPVTLAAGFCLAAFSVSAATINVNSNSALSSALGSVNPGDTIVLANGTYSGFTISRSGTSTAPIVIQAASLHGATISSGTIRYNNGVSYVTIKGLRITTPGSSQTIDGESFRVAVWFQAAQNCRLSQCYLRLSGHSSSTEWVMLSGNSNNNRIDYNEFANNTVQGHYIWPRGNRSGISVPSDRTSWANGNGPNNPNMARNTRIDHNYFHDQGTGTGAAIAFGGIGLAGDYQETFTLVEQNLFTNCDGDAEILEVKSSRNTIRNNTIRTSVGMISLRAGNQSSITGNIMLQGGKSGTGGIKIYEKNHTVTGNHIDNPADYGFVVGRGTAYTSPNFSHAQVVNATITGNNFINMNGRGVIIGHGGDGTVSGPSGGTFSNNALRGSASPLLNPANPGTMTIANNSTSGSNPPPPSTPLTSTNVGPSATPYTSPGTGTGTFGGNYRIMARHSGKAVVVQGASTTNSANVVQYTYGGSTTNDEWQVNDLGGGYYAIINRHSSLAMVVQSASTTDGANIIQYTFGGTATNDEWQIVDAGSGYHRIVNRNSGKVLTVVGASTADGARMEQRTNTGATNQQFQLISVP